MDTITVHQTRVERALDFWRSRGDEITPMSESVFLVPSFTKPDVEHTVDYEKESCSCSDAVMRPGTVCKHLFAVSIRQAKKRKQRRDNFIHAWVTEEEDE